MPPAEPAPTTTKSTGSSSAKRACFSVVVGMALPVLGVVMTEGRLPGVLVRVYPKDLPTDVIAITAVGAHAEEAGQGHEVHQAEEARTLVLAEIRVLVVGIEIGKNLRARKPGRNAGLERSEALPRECQLVLHDRTEA